MRYSFRPKFGLLTVWVFAITLSALAQNPPAQEEGSAKDSPGLPARASAADYSAHASAGAVTIGADFTEHIVALPDGSLSSEEYVVIETGLFGAADAKLKLSLDDFALRINGRKMPIPAQPYGLVAKSLKDPEAEPPSKSKKGGGTSIGSGGDQGNNNDPPPIVHIPVETRRAWTQRLQKASLPEGERPLPQAGFIYFPYGGKAKGIRTIELIYTGPAGMATLTLQQ